MWIAMVVAATLSVANPDPELEPQSLVLEYAADQAPESTTSAEAEHPVKSPPHVRTVAPTVEGSVGSSHQPKSTDSQPQKDASARAAAVVPSNRQAAQVAAALAEAKRLSRLAATIPADVSQAADEAELAQSQRDARRQRDEARGQLDRLELELDQHVAANEIGVADAPRTALITALRQQLIAQRRLAFAYDDRLDALRDRLEALRDRPATDATSRNLAETTSQSPSPAAHLARQQNWLAASIGESKWPAAAALLAAMAVVWWAWWRVTRRLDGPGVARQRSQQPEQLAALKSAGRRAATALFVLLGVLMCFELASVTVGPFVVVAALCLAAGLGAQSLIRDCLAGGMILWERQYQAQDLVTIGDVTATVVRVTLRTTLLRDLEGRLIWIPNAQITTVRNHTADWSRLTLYVRVAYHENVDDVMHELREIVTGMRTESRYNDVILADSEMMGVDELGESSVAIKFRLKTTPTQREVVKQELLRRIKQRFDALGIEMPFPQRTISILQSPASGEENHHSPAPGQSEPAAVHQPATDALAESDASTASQQDDSDWVVM